MGSAMGSSPRSPATLAPRPPGLRTPPPHKLPFPNGSSKPDALAPTQRVGTVVRRRGRRGRRRRRRGRRREELEEEGAVFPWAHSDSSGRPAAWHEEAGRGRPAAPLQRRASWGSGRGDRTRWENVRAGARVGGARAARARLQSPRQDDSG